jgi:hypothetical protein
MQMMKILLLGILLAAPLPCLAAPAFTPAQIAKIESAKSWSVVAMNDHEKIEKICRAKPEEALTDEERRFCFSPRRADVFSLPGSLMALSFEAKSALSKLAKIESIDLKSRLSQCTFSPGWTATLSDRTARVLTFNEAQQLNSKGLVILFCFNCDVIAFPNPKPEEGPAPYLFGDIRPIRQELLRLFPKTGA